MDEKTMEAGGRLGVDISGIAQSQRVMSTRSYRKLMCNKPRALKEITDPVEMFPDFSTWTSYLLSENRRGTGTSRLATKLNTHLVRSFFLRSK